MLTPETLDNWFTYHPPTEETAPKYAWASRQTDPAMVDILSKLAPS